MKLSQFFISTTKEAPAEAEIVSHQLMMRSGMIKKLGAGIYTWMPLGVRVLRKVEQVVREEMNAAGAIELLMPVVQPAELWQESGRWEKMGPEMMRVKDRHERDFIVQPTSEEVITDIARQELRSWRQLPINFYHIQTKFRDERRPRFGVMRSREFIMKDAYSFDVDKDSLMKSYQAMYDAYSRIFSRLGLEFRAVNADTGNIGGFASHEFQVLAESGEDVIAYCPDSDYAANVEMAEALAPATARPAPTQALTLVHTPDKKTCEDVGEFLKQPLPAQLKAMMYVSDAGFVLCMLRADHMVNEIKLGKLPQLANFRPATPEEIEAHLGVEPGYCGPVPRHGKAHPGKVLVVADRTAAAMADFICGANESGYHVTGANWGRDCAEPDVVADIRNVVEGDPSPDGKGALKLRRGIEVGHVFALGQRYSAALGARFLDKDQKEQVMEMGCYGIGVTRVVAAAIEQNHDAKGIAWPVPMAPFTVAIAAVGYDRSAEVKAAADKLHDELAVAGIDVVLDDRGERPGVMFADLELIGIPHRITVGDRGLKEGMVEYQARRAEAASKIALADIVAHVRGALA
ncbi:proline--tRNA ligase [Casimicrobium huifangae]|jgi:prolyl-tRNA synthetase|uniref:proline--tRNA ligase n=1 Tax=Casimicrobium huifangae TaxID=2591109 RepID=UPI0012EBD009|nr:proline--tRNA ligase [Casimicrobium huifangae]